MRRVLAGAYDRISGDSEGDFSTSKTDPAAPSPVPSNTAVFKSPPPRLQGNYLFFAADVVHEY
jgi:hypothetical protein